MRSRHERRAAEVRRVVNGVSETMGAPGLVWAVASGPPQQREVTIDTCGELAADSLFRIASVTKLIATTAALGLVEDGLLDLDEPIGNWVPEWADRRVLRTRHGALDDTVAARRDLTLRDLLTMGVGLGYDMTAPEDDPLTTACRDTGIYSSWLPPDIDPATFIERAAALPMAHQPGEGFLYQSSYDVLTVVLEAATGEGFDDILRRRIHEPLGMTETGYAVEEKDLARVPANFFPDADGFSEAAPAAEPGLTVRPVFCSAATGLLSTAADLIVFAQFLLDGGVGPQGRVLSAASIDAMARDALSPAAHEMAAEFLDPGMTWGLGAGVDGEGRFGWDGGTGTSLWVDPAAQVAGVLLTRQGMGGPQPPEHMTRFWEAVRGEGTLLRHNM